MTTNSVDGGVQALDETDPPDQLAEQEQAGVGRQRGVLGAFVDVAAAWSRIYLKRASLAGVGATEAPPLSQFQRARFLVQHCGRLTSLLTVPGQR